MGHHGYFLSSISSSMCMDVCSLLDGPRQPQQTSKPWELGKTAPGSAIQPCPSEPTLVRSLGLTSLQRKSLLVAWGAIISFLLTVDGLHYPSQHLNPVFPITVSR